MKKGDISEKSMTTISGRKLGYALQPFYPFPYTADDLRIKITPFPSRQDGFIDSYDFRPFDYGTKVFKNVEGQENDGKLTIDEIMGYGVKILDIWGEAKKSDTEKAQLELQIKQREEEIARQKEESNKQLRKTIIISTAVVGGLALAGAVAYFALKKK